MYIYTYIPIRRGGRGACHLRRGGGGSETLALCVSTFGRFVSTRNDAICHCICRTSMILLLEICTPPPPPPAEVAGVQGPLHFVSRLLVAVHQQEMLFLEICTPPPPPPAEVAGVQSPLHFVSRLLALFDNKKVSNMRSITVPVGCR